MIKFKVGAAIWDPTSHEVLSSGTSHPDITLSRLLASVHAEQHALSRVRHLDLDSCWCIIYALNPRGGCPYTSRPCYTCATRLYNRDITRVIYPERSKSGTWIIQSEHPEELLDRATTSHAHHARQMRIPPLTPSMF